MHASPDAQTFPQLPQFFGSLCVLVWPVHDDQVTDPSLLQVLDSVPLLHVPQGCVAAAVQWQAPDEHVTPLMQALPQLPQFELSVCRLAPPVHVEVIEPSALHLLVWVPVLHVPQGLDAGAVHGHTPAVQVTPWAQA